MLITIEQLRVRVGLDSTDSSKDTEINAALAMSESLIENYLDRWLSEGTYTEQFTHEVNTHVSLKAYPLISIDSVTLDNGTGINYHFNTHNGLLFFDAIAAQHQLLITYTGGYGTTYPLPAALELGILLCFDQVWGSFNSQADGVTVGGVVKSIAADGASISFETGSGSTASDIYETDSGLPANVTSILRLFRREFC